jgi:hypothetical protein
VRRKGAASVHLLSFPCRGRGRLAALSIAVLFPVPPISCLLLAVKEVRSERIGDCGLLPSSPSAALWVGLGRNPDPASSSLAKNRAKRE